jgi:hypothetical protein
MIRAQKKLAVVVVSTALAGGFALLGAPGSRLGVGGGLARAQTSAAPASSTERGERPSPSPAGAVPPAAVPGVGPGPGGPGATDTPKVKVERGIGGKKVYRITEEIRIEGKIQKPEAFFFYQKSSINYDWQELKQDFIPRILDSVNQSPF